MTMIYERTKLSESTIGSELSEKLVMTITITITINDNDLWKDQIEREYNQHWIKRDKQKDGLDLWRISFVMIGSHWTRKRSTTIKGSELSSLERGGWPLTNISDSERGEIRVIRDGEHNFLNEEDGS